MRNLTSLALSAFLVSFTLAVSPPAVFAGNGLYATASIGPASDSTEMGGSELSSGGTGYAVGGSVGARFGDFIQYDVWEVTYMSRSQPGYTWSVLNVGTGFRFGAFAESSRLHPYLSAGIGGSRAEENLLGLANSEWGFEWNVGGGVLVDITDSIALGVRYRYRSSAYDTLNGVSVPEVNLNIHQISFEVAFGAYGK